MFLSLKIKTQFLIGPIPIPALTCPDTPELGLLRSRPAQSISLGYGFTPGILPFAPEGPWTQGVHVQNRSRRFCRSSPAFSRICPASVSRMTASGILVQYAG